ncbi:MAG: amidohydrolase family protein, partial [Christensenellaceae bacterium]|nr:amidohydrolase family protein [Christensenellaceae bacterium]
LLPAQTFGMPTKGRMQEGCDADLVLFDPDRVQDMARFSHEGKPDTPCVGVSDVFVDGVHAVHEGQVLCATAGKLLTK